MTMGSLLPADDAIMALEALAEKLNLPGYDLLLIGDGSGTTYSQPAGWACVAYDVFTAQTTVHVGGLSCGTNNFAELAPFLQALWHDHQDHGQAVNRRVRVTIVSDIEVTVRCGNRQYSRNANACLWAGIAWFEEHGYELTWVHVRRNSNEWNTWVDYVAGVSRNVMEEILKVLEPSPAGTIISGGPPAPAAAD